MPGKSWHLPADNGITWLYERIMEGLLVHCAIYARYSCEGQQAESIESQVKICRRYIERPGWTLTQIYDDAAISGASKNSRPAYIRMLLDAEAQRFEIILCEAIDRLSRKLADVANLFDRLTFHGIQIHATTIGLVTQDAHLDHGHNGADGASGFTRQNQTRTARLGTRWPHPLRPRLRLQGRAACPGCDGGW
jgi:hypothetical protein